MNTVDDARPIDPARLAVLDGRLWKAKLYYTYLVFWPSIGVAKAGYSTAGAKRWRQFVKRGAVVVDLVEWDTSTAAFMHEGCLDRHLSSVGRLAFADRAEALPYLGSRGGGYMECYRIDGPGVLAERPVAEPMQAVLRIP